MSISRSARSKAILFLSRQIGVDEDIVSGVASHPDYKRVLIPKSRDARLVRILNIPQGEHRFVQDQLKHFLKRLPISRAAHAYVSGRSVHTNVQKHRASDTFWELDFQDAYPSVTRVMLERALALGIRQTVGLSDYPNVEALAKLVADITITKEDGLPQGAPCSPFLINIVCYQLDLDLLDIADAWNLSFTRYSDDITVSSVDPISRTQREWIKGIIENYGFRISSDKESYKRGKATEPVINGITLTGNHREGLEVRNVGLSKKKLNGYRALIHRAISDEEIPVEKVRGTVEWVLQVYGGTLPNRLKEPLRQFLTIRAPRLAPHYERHLQ